jgi:hypothetical protein
VIGRRKLRVGFFERFGRNDFPIAARKLFCEERGGRIQVMLCHSFIRADTG